MFNVVLFLRFVINLILCHSELWRQENAMQQNLAMLKEELSKKDQGLRSMTGKVR